MTPDLRFRCDVTAERLSRDEPRVGALLVWWTERWQEETRSRSVAASLRWIGLGLSLVGIVLCGFLIVVTPDAPCYRGTPVETYDAAMALLVLFATTFWFLPRIQVALQAWAVRMAGRQAARLCARLRRAAPFTIEYDRQGGRLVGRNEKLGLRTATELGRVERAAFSGDVACLYGRRFPWVKRIVWLPGAAAREALRSALVESGASVAELG